MNAIQTYIENLFKPLPDSREVRRARTELLQMCEDRYTELRNSGASDNEAVGQVITQFGNLDELADDLGIRTEVDTYRDSGVHLSKAEAEAFLAQRRRTARFVAAGVFLCLIGFGIIATLSMAEDAPKGALFTNTGPLSPLTTGLAGLFLFVAVGVSLFFVSGSSGTDVNVKEFDSVDLQPDVLLAYKKEKNLRVRRSNVLMAVGVALIILATAAIAICGTEADSSDTPERLIQIGLMILFPLTGIGVALLTIGGMERSAYSQLTSTNDYTPEQLEARRKIDRIAGPYWCLATLVFLVWGLAFDAWSVAWMVWPIAGVLFGLIASSISSSANRSPRSDRRID
ncbi:permease prefix domain 1-containing protein [Pseudoglutamicibacter cumminsii]|uniref:permease prefix domain 1-containing protein n=1 Tax=Pseudoglutamicibacter cumminsii TaxID=156979 RepID=UPI00195BDEF8|nr:hypothetical protein [Pseudoglutamicibacter cumminsii]